MKKKNPMKIATIVLGIVIVIALSALFLYMNWTIRTGINTIVPKITKTRVQFEEAKLSVSSGKGKIINLVIGNPDGFNTPAAFVMEQVNFTVDSTSFFSKNTVITNVVVDGLKITYEVLDGKSNIGIILNNIEYPFGNEQNSEQPGSSTQRQSTITTKRVFIKNVNFKNVVVNVAGTMLKDEAVNIPLTTLEFNDIGKKPLDKDQQPIKKQKARNQDLKFRTVSMHEMALTLIKKVSVSIVSAITSSRFAEEVEIKESIKNLGDAIKNKKTGELKPKLVL